MITVKVTCENGHTWYTDINGDIDSASEYFMGHYFNTHPNRRNDAELFSKVVEVSEL